jgi:hypothetical protein
MTDDPIAEMMTAQIEQVQQEVTANFNAMMAWREAHPDRTPEEFQAKLQELFPGAFEDEDD